jgi:protein-disulfide isomerase
MLLSRRTVVIAGAAALGGVGPALAQTSDDMTIGAAGARVSLVEYASTTCPHCAAFHEHNWAALKADYIDAGRVRLTMRELLTPPPAVALAMFQLARAQAADANEYFRRLAILYQRQRAFFQAGTNENLRIGLVRLGGEWGLTEAQVMASLNDENGIARIRRSIAQAETQGVTGTPTFFLNGQRVADPAFHTPEGMARALNAAAG